MADNEQNAGSSTEGKQPEKGQPTQGEKTVPMSSYQKLQQNLQLANDRIKSYEAKEREGESVEQALERERQERARLERELGVERAKRTAPETLHGLIDKFVDKHGFVPDAEDIELLSSSLRPSDSTEEEKAPTTSGLRNAPAGKAKSGADLTDEELSRIKLSDLQ